MNEEQMIKIVDDFLEIYIKEPNKIVEYMVTQNQEIDRLNNIIDKAIEYIEERFVFEKDTGAYYLKHTFDGSNVFELLNILQGSDE